jgi:hypothetical protein
MAKWEYKTIIMNRTGTHEDFSYKWTYGPWETIGVRPEGSLALAAGLQEMGRDGWELVGVVPTDVWVEGTKSANSSHGERTISHTLLFKRPLDEGF